MKKLLLSLGAFSAVVAPVAAVVACGSNSVDLSAQKATALKSLETLDGLGNLSPADKATATKAINAATTVKEINAALAAATTAATPETPAQVKAELGTMVKDILAKTAYTMDDAEQTKLVEELFKLDGSKELHPVAIQHGLKSDETHGADDFMVLIGGIDVEDFTGNSRYQKVSNTTPGAANAFLQHSEADGSANWGRIASEFDETDTAYTAKWGETNVELAKTNFVLYLQHDNTSGDVTAQLSKVVKFGDGYFALDEPANYFKTHDPFNAEFALKDFTATHA